MTVSFFGLSEMARPRVKCLIVDDLEENLLALSGLLRSSDVELFQAKSGAEALDLLLQHDIALAILDVQMPNMDGFELAELIRGSVRTQHIPLIFVTAGSRDNHRTFKGYEAGAVDFLYKPIEPHVLLSKAEVFFELHRQKQQLEYELRERTQALQLSEMLMAVLSHDLRDPLQGMMVAAHMIEHVSQEPTVAECAKQIAANGQRMTHLISDVLDLTRTRLGNGIELTRTPTDIVDIAIQIVNEFQLISTTPINFSYDGPAEGKWDAHRLKQVFSNLLGNAIKHGSTGNPVNVIVKSADANTVSVSITNTGEIPADILPHIFDPFRCRYRSDSKTSGLGLGLYIASQIIDAHKGKISVQSRDNTVAFNFELPKTSPR